MLNIEIRYMSHITKLWEMVTEQRLRHENHNTENQFGFM